MKTQTNAPFYNFTSYLLSDVRFAWHTPLNRLSFSDSLFIKVFSRFSGLKNRSTANNFTLFSNSGQSSRSTITARITTFLVELMRRVLAPLRRIVSRELEVFSTDRLSGRPASFAIRDGMECGHTHTSLLWDVFDLLNGYTESAHVKAVRHRCSECQTLTATKKPPQSVGQVKTAVA